MNLAEWRARQAGEEYTLPSGLDVVLKKVALIDLAQGGKIPQTLRAPVDEMMKSRGMDRVGLEQISEFTAVVDLVATACLAGPEGLTLTELPWADKLAIFTWANAQADKLVPFRREQDGAVESAFVVGELRPSP
jgi:hypothetical protein